MNRTSTLCLFFCLLAGAATYAQPTIDFATNAPEIGDTVLVNYTLAPAAADPGAAGNNVTYDFTGLVMQGTREYKYISPSVYADQSICAAANIAVTDGVNDTMFYNSTTAGMELVGEDAALVGFGYAAALTDGPTIIEWPATLNDSWNGPISASFTITGVGAFVRTGSYTATADGAGELLLPNNIPAMEVLRVHVLTQETNTSTLVTVTRKKDVYSYYTKFQAHPVVRITIDSISSSLGVDLNTLTTEWLDGSALSVGELQQLRFDLFPQPSSDRVTLTSVVPMTRVELIDVHGRALPMPQPAMNSLRTDLDVSQLVPGMYIVRVFGADGSVGMRHLVRQ